MGKAIPIYPLNFVCGGGYKNCPKADPCGSLTFAVVEGVNSSTAI
jgi:hypothetical protein